VGISGLDLNNYNGIIKFKKSISTEISKVISAKNKPSETTKVNEYGETVVSRMRQEQTRLNDDEVEVLIKEYQNGKSTKALAERFGCNKATVSRVLKRYGVNVTNRKKERVFIMEDVIAMYENMHTAVEIAQKYGVTPDMVIRFLREKGGKIQG